MQIVNKKAALTRAAFSFLQESNNPAGSFSPNQNLVFSAQLLCGSVGETWSTSASTEYFSKL